MYITKQTSKMKRYTQLLALGGMLSSLSAFASAYEGHDQTMHMNMSASQELPMQPSSTMDHAHHQPAPEIQPQQIATEQGQHDHRREHGGQLDQSTQLDTRWLFDEGGQGTFKSKLKT